MNINNTPLSKVFKYLLTLLHRHWN